jgi:ribosomal subunit interface protein|tara:strand:- start:12733 stop:13047 length:315 start_codon:yes stop_codon:yes gene_type:complete
MTIQFNTDKTINGEERKEDYFTAQIEEELERYQSHITRIEVHLSDENGKKDGLKDIRCLIEARLEGKQPIAASDQADNIDLAVSGALNKLKAALKTIVSRSKNH